MAAPVPPMLRCDDATIEVVAQRLAFAAPKGLLIVRDELAGHLKGMNAYHPGARTFWLESFGGREFRVDRVKHPEPIRIRHCACAWWGGIQPDRLAEVMREADDGLLARFIYVWPEARRFELPSANPDVAVATAALLRLNALEMAEGPDGREPVIVRLDPAALPDLVALARYAQDAQAFAGPLMSSTLGKARGLALRISLVLTMLWWAAEGGTSAPPTTISREAFQAAALLVRDYIMPMAERVFVDAAATMRDRNAATLARWIAKARPSEVHGRFL